MPVLNDVHEDLVSSDSPKAVWKNFRTPDVIIKRDGTKVGFDSSKILNAIAKANKAVAIEEMTSTDLLCITEKVCHDLDPARLYNVEEIQDLVENTLMLFDYTATAKAYILYRSEHTKLRNAGTYLMDIYKMDAFEADCYYRDLWLVCFSFCTMIAAGECSYTDEQMIFILMMIPVGIFYLIYGWGPETDRNEVLLRCILVLFPIFRMCAFNMMLASVTRSAGKGIAIGYAIFMVEVMAQSILEELFQITLVYSMGFANAASLLISENSWNMVIDGRAVTVFDTAVTGDMIWKTIVVSVIFTVVYLILAYINFKQTDRD